MKVLFAAGGTGGHVFPALAIAMRLEEKIKNLRIAFVGLEKGMGRKILAEKGYSMYFLRARSLKGKSLIHKFASLFSLPFSFLQALRIVHSYSPDIVIGTGGYVSAATCLMAWILRKPVFIQEQNSIPGMTNRVLGRFSKKIFLAFPNSEKFFQKHKTRLVGNAIRPVFFESKRLKKVFFEPPYTLTVIGGSQGAKSLNDAVLTALVKISTEKLPFRICHQTGSRDFERIKLAYQEFTGMLDFSVQAFYDDIPNLYAQSDVILARSGAGIYEMAAFGRPMILVPYPYAADDHQKRNAEFFLDQGAAIIILDEDLNGERLLAELQNMLDDPSSWQKRSEQAKSLVKSDAADEIAKEAIHWVGQKIALPIDAETAVKVKP